MIDLLMVEIMYSVIRKRMLRRKWFDLMYSVIRKNMYSVIPLKGKKEKKRKRFNMLSGIFN